MPNILNHVLLIAILCLITAAFIPLIDWLQCTHHSGGAACRASAAAASGRWEGVATTLLAIAVPSGRRQG